MRVRVSVEGVGKGAVWTTAATREFLGFIRSRVIERTMSGVSASGQRFQPYKTPDYGDTERPDIYDTGRTLNSIAPIKINMSGGRLAMTNRERYSIVQNYLHPFMGFLQEDVDAALAHVERKFGKVLPQVPTKMAAKLRARSTGAVFRASRSAIPTRVARRKVVKKAQKLARRRAREAARRASRG